MLGWATADVRAAPEEDFRAGSRAFNSGDVVQAMALLKKSADAGHAPSQSLLGYILDKAEFNDEAVTYYRKAAAQNDPDGQFGLGAMYANGEGVKRDFVEARKWITLAAEKGHGGAINALAQAYISGDLGIEESERNSAEALRWIRRAAESGHLPAMERLAVAYRTGAHGVAIDAQQAQAFEAKARVARDTPEKPAAKKRERK
ncbi:MAG: tetratricopeptide repeat protein [Betaproteobacteria bacterium]